MLSSGANVVIWTNAIIWDEMLLSRMKCYHPKLMLSSGANVITWRKCYHVGRNIIIWDEMLSSGMKANHLE